MNRRKWFLMYTFREPCGRSLGVLQHEEVSLKATTEDEAITEAKAKWEEKDRARKFRGYNHCDPRVIYKILLPQ